MAERFPSSPAKEPEKKDDSSPAEYPVWSTNDCSKDNSIVLWHSSQIPSLSYSTQKTTDSDDSAYVRDRLSHRSDSSVQSPRPLLGRKTDSASSSLPESDVPSSSLKSDKKSNSPKPDDQLSFRSRSSGDSHGSRKLRKNRIKIESKKFPSGEEEYPASDTFAAFHRFLGKHHDKIEHLMSGGQMQSADPAFAEIMQTTVRAINTFVVNRPDKEKQKSESASSSQGLSDYSASTKGSDQGAESVEEKQRIAPDDSNICLPEQTDCASDPMISDGALLDRFLQDVFEQSVSVSSCLSMDSPDCQEKWISKEV